MRTTRTPVVPPRRRPAVAGIRRPSSVAVQPRPAEPEADAAAAEEDGDEAVLPSEKDSPAGAAADSDAGSAEDSGAESAADADGEPGRDAAPRKGLAGTVALLVATALLVAGGVFGLLRADQLTASANVALVDTAGTAEVTRQVRESLEKVFSYRHDDTAATEDAARTLLTGAAREQYDRLFRQVREQAPAQRLTLATRVVSSGVVSLRDGTAVLLVFLDQSAVRGDNGEATTAGAQLSVTAVLTDGRWQISELVPR